MQIILVKIEHNELIFSLYHKKVEEKNLNNTSVIDINNLKFSAEYIENNLQLVTYFLKVLCIKNTISSAVIKNHEIALVILNVLNDINEITNLKFPFDKELDYAVSSLLLSNHNLIHIDCYSMPEIMFTQFPKGKVETRCEILFTSNFMEKNGIDTLSKLHNIDKIEIDFAIMQHDINDIKFFFRINKNVVKIIIKNYDRKDLFTLLEYLKAIDYKKIKVIIVEDSNITSYVLNDIELFKVLKKEYNIDLQVMYSDEYYRNNRMKEISIIISRYILIGITIFAIFALVRLNINNQNSDESLNDNFGKINDVLENINDSDVNIDVEYIEDEINIIEEQVVSNDTVEEVITTTTAPTKSTYVSPYYRNYEQVYSKLLEINPDTVGWLRLNNTKINYPIVQTTDNQFYLKHAFDKTAISYGWVFVDYRNNLDFLDRNTIIYAHNIYKGGLMFGTLNKVLDNNWNSNDENLNIVLDIKGSTHIWRIFSAYTIAVTNDYLVTNIYDEDEFLNFINVLRERSIKVFDTEVKGSDRILTLSTCYQNSNNRLVVHAVMIQ